MTRKYGNRSGAKSKDPRIEFHAPAEAILLWDLAASHAGDDRSTWARRVLTEAAARELKLDPSKAVEALGE